MAGIGNSAASSVVLYGSGLFQEKYPTPTPSYQEQLQQLRKAPLSTVVLWAMHVHADGTFYYNGTPMVRDGKFLTSTDPKKGVNPDLEHYLKTLKEQSSVQKFLVSIGPFQTDFDHIIANATAAKANFRCLMEMLPIDGFDFDYEGSYASDQVKNLVRLTILLHELGAMVTYCPYTEREFWLRCLAAAYEQAGNVQPVSWYNLQCYDGGAGNDPAEWAKAIQMYSQPLGIADANTFVVPGLWVANTTEKSYDGKCPKAIAAQFKQWSQTGTRGGFLWKSSDIFENETNIELCKGQQIMPVSYGEAIRTGIGDGA